MYGLSTCQSLWSWWWGCSSIVCPTSPFANTAAMYSAFMSCHTVPQILKMLLDFNPNFIPNFFLVDSATDSRVVIDPNFSPTTLQAKRICVTKNSRVVIELNFSPTTLQAKQICVTNEHPCVMMQEYKPNFLWIIHKFNDTELENCLGLPKGELQCYSPMANSTMVKEFQPVVAEHRPPSSDGIQCMLQL